ncbi:MAG TPA: hypothetical protein VK149_10350 [Sideroxyarcus sp.]|nr:hypothetical protein [Sideroxyarcus sp.]
MKSLIRFLLVILFFPTLPASAEQEKVAIVVYGQNAAAKQYLRVAQTRIEQLLTDNGVVVLDQRKAEELKKNWSRLSDPGALITAEDFVENAGKFNISGIYRVYLGVGKTSGLASIFTATAVADIRFIGEDARIKSAASAPMGTKGMPPSDGLTESAAVNNAIQRAIDLAAEKYGFKVMDITNPRLVRFSLKSVAAPGAEATEVASPPLLEADNDMVKFAKLKDDDWTSEEPTCVRASTDGRMGAIGTYIMSTTYGFGRPTRTYASALHIVDLDAKSEVEQFDVSIKDARYQKGGSKITDCKFLQSWRYVAAVSQSHLIFADTERGVELGRIYFDDPFDEPSLTHLRAGGSDYLVVGEGSRRQYYQIVRE